MSGLPDKAISIRQPWAFAIIHGGKDIENRTWNTKFTGPICVHAGAGHKKADWDLFRSWVRSKPELLAWQFITPDDMKTGGIVGTVNIDGCCWISESPWFMGPVGFQLSNPQPTEFIPVKGALSLFDWRSRVA